MPKPYTFPTFFDEALQINVSKLKEWGYLELGHLKSGTITWSRNGNETSSISILVNTLDELHPSVELDYKYREESRNYKVPLVSVPSNLGKGVILYFLCPQTNKRCRKLYSVGGYFLHREAFNGCMYESQSHGKKDRYRIKTLDMYNRLDELHRQLYKKHFKRIYSGKPTKRYLRLMEQIKLIEKIPFYKIKQAIRK